MAPVRRATPAVIRYRPLNRRAHVGDRRGIPLAGMGTVPKHVEEPLSLTLDSSVAPTLAPIGAIRRRRIEMKRRYLSSLAAVGFAALLCGPSPALAQAYLGSSLSPFAVLGGSTVTNTGLSVVTGDLGVSPGTAVTGFPPGIVTGTIHAADATAAAAQVDLTTAFNTLTSQPCGADLTGQDLGGLTLTPGVYCFSTSAQLTGTLTLNALGNPSAVWVFRIGSTLTTASGSSVVFINGSNANACGAEWRVGSSATLGTGTNFAGNILAQASVTLNTNANLIGRALARTGAVTLDDNDVSFGACSGAAPPPFPGPVPTLPEIGAWALLLILLGSGAYLLSRRTPTEASR